jgi:hypothetical protein
LGDQGRNFRVSVFFDLRGTHHVNAQSLEVLISRRIMIFALFADIWASLVQVDPGYTFGENDWSDEEMMRKFGIWYPVSALAFPFLFFTVPPSSQFWICRDKKEIL